jgi:chromosomal replication initiation ATPase DnaA
MESLSQCDMNTIFTAVQTATGIKREQLCSDERHRQILFARYIAIRLLYEHGTTMEKIGDTLHRTRQGVSKSLHTHSVLLESDYLYRNTYSLAKLLLSVPANHQFSFVF